jgi:hypothetical protein
MKFDRRMIAIFAMTTIFLVTGASMAFGKTFVLCSAFSGQLVTEDDQPVGGIKIIRTWNWRFTGETGSDQTVTDADGRFEFQPVTGKSLLAQFAPHEPSIRQELTAHGRDGEVKLWDKDKSNYDMDGESGFRLNMLCGLDKAPAGERLAPGTCVIAN